MHTATLTKQRTALERAGSVGWLFHVDARELKHYLNYPGSRLRPLTKVRVDFQSFDHGNLRVARFEDFWFQQKTPLGVRRYCNPRFPQGNGAIVVDPPASPQDANTDAVVNVALRLLLDCHLEDAQVVKLQVSDDQYDEVASALESYGFSRVQNYSEQLCIHLRCDSYKQDERPFYYGR